MDKKSNIDAKLAISLVIIVILLGLVSFFVKQTHAEEQTEEPSPIVEVSEWCLQKCANETDWINTRACLSAWCGIEVSK